MILDTDNLMSLCLSCGCSLEVTRCLRPCLGTPRSARSCKRYPSQSPRFENFYLARTLRPTCRHTGQHKSWKIGPRRIPKSHFQNLNPHSFSRQNYACFKTNPLLPPASAGHVDTSSLKAYRSITLIQQTNSDISVNLRLQLDLKIQVEFDAQS